MAKNNKKTNLEENLPALKDAISLAQKQSEEKKRKFIESLDIAIKLGIDPKQTAQKVKGSVLLPEGLGKEVKVIVISGDEALQKQATELGAVEAGGEELIKKINDGFIDFDTCIATPDIMPKVSKVARKLGPRGLMPSPKNGTVTTNIELAIKNALKGKVDFKNENGAIIHCPVGKINFTSEQLINNIKAIIKAVKELRPEDSKGKYIKEFYINTTMGQAIKVDTESLN